MNAAGDQGNLNLRPAPLLDWLPNETLFSLCSRLHAFWGYSLPDSTSALLFGGRRAGSQHDLPGHLDALFQKTGGALGLVEDIAAERTLLRYFRPFLAADEYANAIAAMRSSSVAHLKFSLGLLTSRFRANHPLKVCRRCLVDDRKETGWPYWHIQHQYPGVWVCLRHGTLLFESALKATGVSRFGWILPSEQDAVAGSVGLTDAAMRRWCSLAEMIVGMVDAEEAQGWLPIDRLQAVLKPELAARGWSSSSGQLRIKQIAAAFVSHVDDLVGLRELAALPRTISDAEVQLGRLLRPMRSGTHPLRYLVLMDWLFPSAAALRCALGKMLSDVPSVRPEVEECGTQRPGAENPDRDEVLRRIKAGEAPSSVARGVGVDVATAQAWAAQAGITTARRPSVLKPTVHKRLVRDLSGGMDKQTAASKSNVSVSTVNKLLRTTVGLHQRWMSARYNRAREEHRCKWQESVQIHRSQGVKFIRALLPSTYAWLYRNDRAWLDGHLPDRAPQSPVSVRVEWDARDHDLKTAVQRAALELSERRTGGVIRLSQILQLVPELKAKQNQLGRLPLTSRALKDALGVRRRKS